MPLGITKPSTAPGERAVSYAICPLFTYSIFHWDIYEFFWGGFSTEVGRDFLRESFPWGIMFAGEIPKENFLHGWLRRDFQA